MTSPLPRIAAVSASALLAVSALAACGAAEGSDADVSVVASFYPLEFVTEQIGGTHVEVTNLTAAGTEPHDLELAAQQMAAITDADLVVYLSGFQPAVDKATSLQAPDTAFDVATATTLREAGEGEEHDHEGEGEEGHDHGGMDPHVWLDPTKLDEIAAGVADRLAEADPEHKQDFQDNAAAFSEKLATLDEEFTAGLTDCRSTDIVTSHEAFGYLAARYGLHETAVSGLSPDSDPGADTIKQVSDFVNEHGVTTIFYETLVNPAVAETIAAETGATTAVLDPIEGIAPDSSDDYFSIMRANLAALNQALGCAS